MAASPTITITLKPFRLKAVSDLARRCEGLWPEILSQLGLSLSPKALRHQNVPCPICGGRDRFQFSDRGRGLWVCHGGKDGRGCNRGGGGVGLIMHWRGASFAQAARLIEATGLIGKATWRPSKPSDRDHAPVLRPSRRAWDGLKVGKRSPAGVRVAQPQRPPGDPLKAWRKAGPIVTGSPVDIYLRGRGLELASSEARSLRSHSRLWHWPTQSCWPAMVALVSSSDGEELCAHQTFLALDGSSKAPIEMSRLFPSGTGAALAGAGVWFGIADADSEFIVAEGVESTLSSMRLFNATAGCAALSADGITRLILPRDIQRIRVMADYDGKGLAAAHAAAKRWRGEDRTVQVSRSAHPGLDANDVWLSRLRRRADG
jgi:putative DNA primase/helicase